MLSDKEFDFASELHAIRYWYVFVFAIFVWVCFSWCFFLFVLQFDWAVATIALKLFFHFINLIWSQSIKVVFSLYRCKLEESFNCWDLWCSASKISSEGVAKFYYKMNKCEHGEKITKFCVTEHCHHKEAAGCDYCIRKYHFHLTSTLLLTEADIELLLKNLTLPSDIKFKARNLQETALDYLRTVKTIFNTWI